jgi:ElaB/YqjD/DUF883 family membrane-anchored ribosome-binding protein
VAEEEVAVVEQSPDEMRAEMVETRAGLSEKVGQLEQGIKDTWEGATTAVGATVESVKSMVADSAQSVRDVVQDTGRAIGRAFDLPAHVRRHPWATLGGAILLGVLAGLIVSRRRG